MAMQTTTVVNSNITVKTDTTDKDKVIVVASGAGNFSIDAASLLMAIHNAINVKN